MTRQLRQASREYAPPPPALPMTEASFTPRRRSLSRLVALHVDTDHSSRPFDEMALHCRVMLMGSLCEAPGANFTFDSFSLFLSMRGFPVSIHICCLQIFLVD